MGNEDEKKLQIPGICQENTSNMAWIAKIHIKQLWIYGSNYRLRKNNYVKPGTTYTERLMSCHFQGKTDQDPSLLMDSQDWNVMAFELKMICVTIRVILDANNIPLPRQLLRGGRILPMPSLPDSPVPIKHTDKLRTTKMCPNHTAAGKHTDLGAILLHINSTNLLPKSQLTVSSV